MPSAIDLAERVHAVAVRLESTDLRPGPAVDDLFSELVSLTGGIRPSQAEEVLRILGPRVDTIRRLCAAGESELEMAWSLRIAESSDPWQELLAFPYTKNYRDLVALELAALAGVGVVPRSVAMLGSGPLPLTGVVMAHDHDLEVQLVDRDDECLSRGAALVDALNLPRASSVRADVLEDDLDLSGFDVVVFAALVGSDGLEKRAALSRVARSMRPGTHLLVRSAVGLRELLYPPASVYGVPGLTMLVELHPHHDVVNSVLVARRDDVATDAGR